MRYFTCVFAAAALLCSAASPAQSSATSSKTGTDPGATRPGDEQMTCEQIYAQGMAQAQRDQQERSKTNAQRRQQVMGTAALVTGAAMTGGLGGTGEAAQMAAEAQADRQIAELGTPQSNPRMEHLKQLWAQKHCVMK